MERSLSNWIQSYLEYTYESEPPDLYKEWVAVSVIASVLQRKCFLRWGDLTFYPNMYVVLVGPSGRCRKGTAMGPAAKFLRELKVKMAAEAITREALIRELRKSNSNDINPDTSEMTLHSSLTIFAQELTVFLGYNNTALMSDLTDWYDCRDRWTYRTKNMGTDEIINVFVNLIGATTPELVQSTLPRDAVGGGLTSRIIFVYESEKSKLAPTPFLSDKSIELSKQLLYDLERIGTMRGEFKVTPEFIDIYVDWYIAQSAKPPFDDIRFAGYVERRANHLFKLCIIHSASLNDKKVVDKKIFATSLDLLKRTEIKMPLTFAGFGKALHIDTMNRIMLYIGTQKEVTYTELLKKFYFDADKDTMDAILGTLTSMKFCQQITTQNGIIIKHLSQTSNDE